MKRILLFPIIVIISIQTGWAQMNVNAHASAQVIETIMAREIEPLNFGKFSPETYGGIIILSPNGVRTSLGNISLIGGFYNPAIFYITGQPNFNINVNLPNIPILLTNKSNGKIMIIENWESTPNINKLETKILNNGTFILNVGARLKVGPMIDNPPGIYSGEYIITFLYN